MIMRDAKEACWLRRWEASDELVTEEESTRSEQTKDSRKKKKRKKRPRHSSRACRVKEEGGGFSDG